MENKAKILDIAMNLNRIGNWAADDYKGRKKRLVLFINQTQSYLNSLDIFRFPTALQRPLRSLSQLLQEGLGEPKDTLFWAEKMMTWGNILTHRASLLK